MTPPNVVDALLLRYAVSCSGPWSNLYRYTRLLNRYSVLFVDRHIESMKKDMGNDAQRFIAPSLRVSCAYPERI